MSLIISALFIHNIVLYYGCGVLLIASEKDNWKIVAKIGIVNVAVMTVSSFLFGLLENFIINFYIITYIKPIIYIIIVAVVSAALCICFSKINFFSEIKRISGIMLIDNTALIWGLSIVDSGLSIWQYIIAGFSCGVGFFIVIVIVSAIMERIEDENVLPSFRGVPIILIIFGIVGIALSFIE